MTWLYWLRYVFLALLWLAVLGFAYLSTRHEA